MIEQNLISFISHFFLGSARLMGLFTIVPIFSSAAISGSIRTAIIVAFGIPFTIAFADQATAYNFENLDQTLPFVGLLVKEYLLGFLLGIGVATVFWSIQAVGIFIDNQRGATIASSIDPLSGTQSSPLGMMLMQVFTAYFILSGGLQLLLGALALSYEVWRLDEFYPSFPIHKSGHFLSLLDFVGRTAVRIAAPVIIAMMMAEWSLALISRFAPQLNVFNVAFSVKSGVAIIVLFLYISTLFPYLREEFFEMNHIIQQIESAVTED